MYSLLKKLIGVLLVLYLVALVLNLKVGGRPTREWTLRAWQSEGVQKVYRTVRDRIMALIRKDISVEDAFKPDPYERDKKPSEKSPEEGAAPPQNLPVENRTILLEKLDEKDRKALEQILEKSGK